MESGPFRAARRSPLVHCTYALSQLPHAGHSMLWESEKNNLHGNAQMRLCMHILHRELQEDAAHHALMERQEVFSAAKQAQLERLRARVLIDGAPCCHSCRRGASCCGLAPPP